MKRWIIRSFFIGLLLLCVAVWAECGNARRPTSEVAMEKKYKLSKEQIKRLVPPMGGCMATDRILVDGEKVGYMYREENQSDKFDSGWCFFAGDESQEYLEDISHTAIYDVNTVANYDPDAIPYLNTPAPCAFEKISGTHRYRPVDPPIPPSKN